MATIFKSITAHVGFCGYRGQSIRWQGTEPGMLRRETLAFLTHPAHRGRGWATATTSAVVGRAVGEGKVLLYSGDAIGPGVVVAAPAAERHV